MASAPSQLLLFLLEGIALSLAQLLTLRVSSDAGKMADLRGRIVKQLASSSYRAEVVEAAVDRFLGLGLPDVYFNSQEENVAKHIGSLQGEFKFIPPLLTPCLHH